MKILKYFVIDTVTLYIVSLNIRGMSFDGGVKTLLLAGVVLAIAQFLIKPLINLLLLPINLLTFGLFKWVSYAVTLYLVTLLVSGFKITEFYFSGLSSYWFSLPVISLSGIFAFVAFSFLISTVSSIISWIMK